eukprot:6643933-Prorocentrum_lima.AAC.1
MAVRAFGRSRRAPHLLAISGTLEGVTPDTVASPNIRGQIWSRREMHKGANSTISPAHKQP